MRRLAAATCCGLGLLAGVPAAAAAAGGPVPAVQGGAGATAPGSPVRYVAVGAHGGTVLQRISRADGIVERARFVRGSLGVPGVGYDGSTTGLSADGRTLVLAEPINRFPVHRTRLAVVDPRSLRVRRRLVLRGFFTVDAISPDGRSLYLIRYSNSDPLRYAVRAFDLRTRRLLPGAIVDAREPDEVMRGVPVTRATSADGRWAYTLYDRGEDAPFIHALDTQTRTARCIDLPALAGTDMSRVRLRVSADGATLTARDDAFDRALVDTRSFAVREPRPFAAAPPAARVAQGARADGDGGGGPSWVLGGAVLAALALAGGLALAARALRPRPGTRSP